MNDVTSQVFKHWIHSREEDIGKIRVYRTRDYNFPPSRGREGFEFKKNGEFIRYGIGPTDSPQKIMGTWEVQGNNHIKVFFEETKYDPYTMEVISCDEKILKVRLI